MPHKLSNLDLFNEQVFSVEQSHDGAGDPRDGGRADRTDVVGVCRNQSGRVPGFEARRPS